MTKNELQKIYLKMIFTKQNYVYLGGELYTLGKVLSLLKGEKIEEDQALQLITR